ncbi:MAG: AAA family ATPase [Bacteroidia bacterium]
MAKKFTFLDLSEKVLRHAQIPLTVSEMWEIATQKGWTKQVDSKGKTPWSTMGALLYVDVLLKESKFITLGNRPKKFALKGFVKSSDVIEEIHEQLFLYLTTYRETHPNFYFLLRDSDAHGRLEKGYWFWGNEEYLMFSCWKGINKQTGGRIIGFVIEKDGTCTLRLSATDDEQKAKIVAAMASILPDMKRIKSEGAEVDMWERWYESKDYLANLQAFIENDVPKITTILSLASPEIVAEFIPITADAFEKNIARIEAKRAQKQEKTLFDDTRPYYDSHLLLKQLSIENIGIFSKLSLEFSPNVTVLIGENGIGKTTILRAIALALAGVNENSLLDARHPKIQQMLHIHQELNREADYAEKGKIYLSYESRDYLEGDKMCQNTLLFSQDKFGIKVEDDPNSDFASVENDKFPHLVIGFSQVQNADIPLTVKQIPYEKLAAIKEAHIKDLLPLIYNQPDSRFEAFGNWIVSLYNLGNQKLIENPKLTQVREHQLIHFVFEIISRIIETEMTFKGVKLAMGRESQNIVWIRDAVHAQDIPLHLISQGFNSVFGWVGYLMMRMYETEGKIHQLIDSTENADADNTPSFFNINDHAIVLIDEIDTYLHPKWQRKVLSVLMQAFPKVQFVVTTHSPLVLSTLDSRKTIAYRIQKDGTERISHFYGTRIQDLIYQEYGIKERPAEEVQQKIELLYEAIEEENKTVYEPLYQELMEMLGENDPAMLDAQFLMEEKELI